MYSIVTNPNGIDSDFLFSTISDLVRLPSINPPGDEHQVANYVMTFFDTFAIPTTCYPVASDRTVIVGKIPGERSDGALAFTGHMDVVPVSPDESRRWTSPPFSGEISDGFLHGRGSADMKGGLGACMVTMAHMKKQGILPPTDIYLIATVDEEDGMIGSKRLLHEPFLRQIDRLIVCEPTQLTLATAGRGRTYANIHVKGQTGHGSQGKSGNAIDYARCLLNAMEEITFGEYASREYGTSFWQPLAINAGVEPCVVPDEVQIKVDARLVPSQPTDSVWEAMDSILASLKTSHPQYCATVEIIDRREGWIHPENAWVKTLDRHMAALGLSSTHSTFPGTTDGSVLRQTGMDCLIIGPGDLSTVHRENEKVSLNELLTAANLYYQLILTH